MKISNLEYILRAINLFFVHLTTFGIIRYFPSNYSLWQRPRNWTFELGDFNFVEKKKMSKSMIYKTESSGEKSVGIGILISENLNCSHFWRWKTVKENLFFKEKYSYAKVRWEKQKKTRNRKKRKMKWKKLISVTGVRFISRFLIRI